MHCVVAFDKFFLLLTFSDIMTLNRSIEYLSRVIEDELLNYPGKSLVVGISGPQGSGKSFLADNLVPEINAKYPTINTVGALMDDFYLPYDKQQQLTQWAIEENGNNKLLQGRGLPGTHDMALLTDVLNQIKNGNQNIEIPKYDKSAFKGKGDRRPKSEWLRSEKPINLFIFEGWFNGFKALDDDVIRLRYLGVSQLSETVKHTLYHIENINKALKDYDFVWKLFDHFIYLETNSIDNVYKWRIQQEHNLIKLTGDGMSDDAVQAFVKRYMPLYELYYADMCKNGVGCKNLKFVIDEHRNLLN